jgi:acyl-CoA thioesterase-1
MVTATSAFINSAYTRRLAAAICLILAPPMAPVAAQEATIVALGDSNTQGFGVNPQDAFPARLEAILRRSGHPVQVVNAGVMGNTLGGLLARVETQVRQGTRIVIVQGGFNDIDQDVPANVSAANMRAILARVQARGAKAVLCGFFDKKWDAIGRGFAAKYNAVFVPGSTCYDPDNKGPDDLHMSAAGHAVVAARLARIIGPMLEPNSSLRGAQATKQSR